MSTIAVGVFVGFFGLMYASCVPLISLMLMMNALRRYSLKRRLRVQFSFFDIYVLMGMLSVSGVVLASIPKQEHKLIAIAAIWVSLASSWYYGVRLVSRSGITELRPRLLIQLIATPLSACGPYFLIALLVGVFNAEAKRAATSDIVGDAYVEFFWHRITLPYKQAEMVQPILAILWLVCAVLYLVVPVYLSRRVIAGLPDPLLTPVSAPAPQPQVVSEPRSEESPLA